MDLELYLTGWQAGKGLKPFEKKYPTVKLLANYYILSVWLATLDPDLKSGRDLTGKKIGIGRPVRVNMAVEPEWVVRHGWGIRDQVIIEYLGAKQIITTLLDGLVDASAILGYFNPLIKA